MMVPWGRIGEVSLGMGPSAPGRAHGSFGFHTQAGDCMRGSAENQRQGVTQQDSIGVGQEHPWLTLELPLPQGNPFPWPKIKHGALPSPDNTSNPCPLDQPQTQADPPHLYPKFLGNQGGTYCPRHSELMMVNHGERRKTISVGPRPYF